MRINVDMDKYKALNEEASSAYKIIKQQNEKLDDINKKIKNLFPKGYWWAFDIDYNWKRPKKYSIREICNDYITVKEVFKKAPWKGFTGLTTLSFERFLKLDIYKTEEEAKVAAYNRPCPKCGGPMKYTTNVWCEKCLFDRHKKAEEYRHNHAFYEPNRKLVYIIEYTDELTREKGSHGRRFVFRRLDTGEIIETDNLWSSYGADGNVSNLPLIEFIEYGV